MQELACKASDEAKRHAFEVVDLDEFVEIDRELLEGDTQVVAEVEVSVDAHDPRLVFLVFCH
jgi:hypothetical protein